MLQFRPTMGRFCRTLRFDPPSMPQFGRFEVTRNACTATELGRNADLSRRMGSMPYAGDDVAELEARQEPRLVRALEMVAPGTAVREGLDNIVQARTGALICIGDAEELNFLLSGGVRLDVDYTPALLFQVAKMDGAIVLSANGTKMM